MSSAPAPSTEAYLLARPEVSASHPTATIMRTRRFSPCAALALGCALLSMAPGGLASTSESDSSVGEHDRVIRRIEAVRLSSAIRLDGVLDETVWQRPSAAPLVQNEPDNGVAPRNPTDWWVAYDEEAIYVAARMHDAAPDSIMRNTGRRDSYPNSDWLFLNLDTFNDDRNGFTFSLSPAGVQRDGVLYNDGWDDMSWDGVWDYGVRIDDQGWAAEIRIPFSQLNFPDREEQTWGINLSRRTRRFRERDDVIHLPRGESGYIRRFPDLVGICGIKPGRPLEVLAYGAGKGEYVKADPGDPFNDGSEFEGNVGADLKWCLSSNLMLNATINPDFGQVEVDPAVVNLSDFETFFPERRPFFVKDANTFSFGNEGTSSNWNFNWMDPQLFYSRRVGRGPTLSLGSHDYAEVPATTTILGAGKLSGKIGATTLGILSAVTAEERADLDLTGRREQQVVEPLANYTAARLKRMSDNGNRGLGIMMTSVLRDLPDARSKDELTRTALSGGIDGWTMLDDDAVWALRGYISGSHVAGDAQAIDAIQRSYRHYFQRPEATHVDYDPERTHLNGWIGRAMLNKQSGRFRLNSSVGVASPGYEIGDLGFQSRSDKLNTHLAMGWHWLDPGKVFRTAAVDAAVYRLWDYQGNPDAVGSGLFYSATLNNWWAIWGSAFWNPEYDGLWFTRGGPAMRVPAGYEAELYVDSDGRRSLYGMMGGGMRRAEDGSRNAHGEIFLRANPLSSLEVSVNPELSWTFDTWQWVSNVDDPAMTATDGTRYIFGTLDYRRFALTTRIDWTLTPKLTLQTYIQPLLAAGEYTDLKELDAPGSGSFNHYGRDLQSTIVLDDEAGEYAIDPDGPGQAESFSLSNPDFNFKSLKINMILRWEYRPGSTFYAVWSQGRTNYDHPGDFEVGRDTRALFDAESENVFMIKMTHWFEI